MKQISEVKYIIFEHTPEIDTRTLQLKEATNIYYKTDNL